MESGQVTVAAGAVGVTVGLIVFGVAVVAGLMISFPSSSSLCVSIVGNMPFSDRPLTCCSTLHALLPLLTTSSHRHRSILFTAHLQEILEKGLRRVQ